jgi:hypothetical protein
MASVSIHRREDNVFILVDSSVADSLYDALREAGLSSTFSKRAITTSRIRRTSDGRIERDNHIFDSSIELTDCENRAETVIESWLASQT